MENSTQVVLVKDINPGSNGSYPRELTEFKDKLYFTASNDENGRELWTSDGTTEETVLVKDIEPGTDSSFIVLGSIFTDVRFAGNFTELDDKLYFQARNEEIGYELWVSDGTSEGTQLVLDINLGKEDSYPGDFTTFNNKLYFSATDGVNGDELWVSDGTSEGTQLVLDINPGSNDSFGRYSGDFTTFNGKLYFGADDGVNGAELWVSDGTSEGTQLVRDINPESVGRYGQGSSRPEEFTELDGLLYFTADDGESRKLWVSDGTSEGTQLVSDIELFRSAFFVDYLSEANGELYFSANKEETGSELYKLVVKDPVNTISGTNGADRLTGTDGNDQIEGKSGRDTIKGAKGDDTLKGDRGSDNLFGGVGDDNLFGGSGADILNGGGGDDALYGDRGSDNLFGAIGDDSLFGGKGNDLLNGGSGEDVLTGGGGKDTFILRSNQGLDTITDFDLEQDRISLAGGLEFEDLSFSGSTILSNEEILVTLDGVDTESLTEAVFEQFELK